MNRQKSTQFQNLHDYLQTLPPITLDLLYNHPLTCLAVFRELPQLSQHCVLRQLFLKQNFTEKQLLLWFSSTTPSSLVLKSIDQLKKFYILVPLSSASAVEPSAHISYQLNARFQDNLRTALIGVPSEEADVANIAESDNHTTIGKNGKKKKSKEKSITELDEYAKERWHTLLNFLVQGAKEDEDSPQLIGNNIEQIVIHSGIMIPSSNIDDTDNNTSMETDDNEENLGNDDAVEIGQETVQDDDDGGGDDRNKTKNVHQRKKTKKLLTDSHGDLMLTTDGFQFLLMDLKSQNHLGVNAVAELLSLLFQLSFATPGKTYSSIGYSENELQYLQHLRELGLVYQKTRKSHRYTPTRMIANLGSHTPSSSVAVPCSSLPATSKAPSPSIGLFSSERNGYLIVETNYRIYAYTSSSLEIGLLALFSQPLYRFPNLVVALLSRETVREALRQGITANQIIGFLESHAHPEMLKKKPIIPPTIVDQIRLWEMERQRIHFDEGVLYDQFLTQDDFEVVRNYAKDNSVLKWDNPKNRTVVVTKEGHDAVKKFWRRFVQEHQTS